MRILTLFLLLLLPVTTTSAHAAAVGFQEVVLDAKGARPIPVALWYPTHEQNGAVSIGENAVFYGEQAILQAQPSADTHALILLSHGYRGSWRNLNWLGAALAAQGYIVAAPNHPGTTTINTDPVQAAALWQRPHDVSRVIDALLQDPGMAGSVDAQRIAAMGHSLGGWTVLALAGARFNVAQLANECWQHPELAVCRLQAELGLNRPELEQNMQDPRVRAIVSLDLGLARGFLAESLSTLTVPTLVIAAGTDIGDMPVALESGYLADLLPQASNTFLVIPDAAHFSMMQLCKPGAVARLEAEVPGDGIICKDGGNRSRQAIHTELLDSILPFLHKNIALQKDNT